VNLDFPKAEIHLHLEGTIEPQTLCELAARRHVALTEEEVAARYRYADFLGFLQAFKWVTQYLQTPEDYQIVALRMFEKLHRQNVVYAEVYFSAGICLWKGMEVDPIFDALEEARLRAEADWGIRARWIFDAVRQFGIEAAERVFRLAARWQHRHVIGIGIGGDEKRGAPAMFQTLFEAARSAGLRLLAHAGENTGPEFIWESIRKLGAQRIGHGVSAICDPALVQYLRDTQIPIEVCVTSNYATGVVARGAEHPVRRMFDAGLLVVINSDDPAMFGTTLNDEYRRLVERHGFTEDEITVLAQNSFQAAFLTEQERQEFLKA
jgi:adenosine deaminase/aminodeoxyfutalosine deaminase